MTLKIKFDEEADGQVRCEITEIEGCVARGETSHQALRRAITGALEDMLSKEDSLQFFRFSHLRDDLQETSFMFTMHAVEMMVRLPRCPQRTRALDHLLLAKDAAVRARLWTDNSKEVF